MGFICAGIAALVAGAGAVIATVSATTVAAALAAGRTIVDVVTSIAATGASITKGGLLSLIQALTKQFGTIQDLVAANTFTLSGILKTTVQIVDSMIASSLRGVTALIEGATAVAASAVVKATEIATSLIAPIAAKIAPLVASTTEALRPIYTHGSLLVNTISGGVQAIGQALHINTLLRVHRIAGIVSPEYRRQTQELNRKISQVSNALGLGPTYLNLLIANSRAVWLDVSTLAGKPYDLAEVEWLGKLNEVLGNISFNMEAYESNPQQLITDLAEWVDRPAADEKARIMKETFGAIDELIDKVDPLVTNLNRFSISLNNLISDLPEDIRKEVEKFASFFTRDFREWIDSEYKPSLARFDELLEISGNDIKAMQEAAALLIERMKRPGDYIATIDSFSGFDRTGQEDVMDEMSSRTLRERIREYESDVESSLFRSEQNQEFGNILPAGGPFDIVIVQTPQRPAHQAGIPRKTWFVGDF